MKEASSEGTNREVSKLRVHASGGFPGIFELCAIFSVVHFSKARVHMKFSKENVEKLINSVSEAGEGARPWQKM